MNNFIMFLIFVPILALILLALNIFLAPHLPYEAKVTPYECGYSAIPGQTRSTFQVQFYLVAILFLVFDLEILLLLPIAVSLYQVGTFGFSVAIIFFIVLTIGFVLEIGTGAIKLTSSQSREKSNNSLNNPLISKNNKIFNNKSYAENNLVNITDLRKQKIRKLKRHIEIYLEDKEEIENISYLYEIYYIKLAEFEFGLKSKILKNKIKNEKGQFLITNKDLEIFKIKSESTDHIVLTHIDINNWYMIDVSISKFNPEKYGNYIFYNLTFYERTPGWDTDFYVSKRLAWADEITVDAIYKEYSPLKLKLQSHHSDYTRDFNNINLNLLLINPLLITTKYIRSLSSIFDDMYKEDTDNLETFINNNYCSKYICNVLMNVYNFKHSLSLQNRFIINNKLFEIDPVFINNLIKINNLNENNIVNFLSGPNSKKNCKQSINIAMNLTADSKDQIIKRLFFDILNKKPKVYCIIIFDFNKDNLTLNFNYTCVKETKKDKFKNIFYTDKFFNMPDFFFYDHFKENFDSKINIIKTDIDEKYKYYLNNNQVNLISTLCFVYNLDETFKNKLYLLHFNHITGKIDFYLDYYSSKLYNLENASHKLYYLEKVSHKKYNKIKLISFILVILNIIHKNIIEFKTKDNVNLRSEKRTNNFNHTGRRVVQLSTTVLNNTHNNGEVNNTFNSYKLLKLSKSSFDFLSDESNVTFSLVDLYKPSKNKFLPSFLKDFLIIYKNKKNSKIKIGDIILNFNKLVESRYRKIQK